MASLHYLTVQDILWINLQITKKVHHYNYARLEEATFYQYAYGESKSLVPQAARFLPGFARMRPFDAGNEATAFVACAAFLELNGREMTLSDDEGAKWAGKLMGKQGDASDLISQATREVHDEHHDEARPDIRGAITRVMERYPRTVSSLSEAAAAV